MIEKKIVYLPVNGDNDYAVCHFNFGDWGHIQDVKSQEGYFFTQEQLNNYTQNIIKESLEIAYKNAKINYDDYFTTEIVENASNSECSVEINEKSITNSFNEIYEKLKV